MTRLLVLLLVALAAAGCSLAPPPPVPAPSSAVLVLETAPADLASALAAVEGATALRARTVLVPVSSPTTSGLADLTALAHEAGLAVHATVRPSGSTPTTATWSSWIRDFVTRHDIDGLHFDAGIGLDHLEAAVVEALLVRPHLRLSAADDGALASLAGGLMRIGDLPLDTGAIPLWRGSPRRTVALDLSAARGGTGVGRVVRLDSAANLRITDSHGWLRLLLPTLPDTLRLDLDGAPIALETRFWKPPFRYVVDDNGAVSRAVPWVELRAAPSDTTSRDTFEFLARTAPEAHCFIAGVEAKVYRTGVFFDSVGLAEGVNRVRVEARWPDGARALYELDLVYRPSTPRAAFPLWIDTGSMAPGSDLELLANDVVRLSFRGSRGQHGSARLQPGGLEITMSRTDGDDASTYAADLHLSRLESGRTYRVQFTLSAADEAHRGKRQRLEAEATIRVRELHDFPLLSTSRPESYLSYSLGSVRLGGPYIAEYGEGVVLQASGRLGKRWRVRLSPSAVGYINERYVDELPAGSVRPRYFLRSVSAAGSDSADVLHIPWSEPVPYAVRPDPHGRRLLVTLYGVETSSTWLAHRTGLRYLDKVTWRQVDAETYELALNLTTERIWGYEVVPRGKSLVVRLPHPPDLSAADEDQPLRGLRLAIEAGHGGSSTGAIGLSGLPERDVNLATALALGARCRAAGAEVYQLRTDRDGVPYMARRDSVRASGADVFISIHANAAGGGFLRAGGTSTYYHNPFWEPLASRIYTRLLELGYNEFGVVGSFNYRPTRMSWLPAVLVEQAFMTHAEDEELLASEAGRAAIAEQVYRGLVDWLAEMGAPD